MKSKNSFFNKTIFLKNVTLYWPIWGAYALLLLCLQPFVLWINLYNAKYYSNYTYNSKLSDLMGVLNMDIHFVGIALVSVVIGMALFHYLYNSKSANMIHALPVNRTQLFFTNVLSGLAFLAVPQMFSAIVTAIVSLSYGVKDIQYIGIWFLLVLGTDVVAFAFVTFCAMFTGHIVALPVYVFIANYLSYWVYYLIYVVVCMFGYGVNELGAGIYDIANTFSPLNCFMDNIGWSRSYNAQHAFTGATVIGENILLIYLFVSIVLYAIAYVIYQRRHIEQAGEIITVQWVKPIFRFGVGITGGFFGSVLIREILLSMGIPCGVAAVVIMLLVIGAVCYFAADMLIKKSFHVFKKKNWIGCGVFSVVSLVCFFGLYGVSGMYENYIPELNEIENATISFNYDITYEGEEAETILTIHNALLENVEYAERMEESGNWNYDYVTIQYTLKNGDYVYRGYRLYYEDGKMNAIIAQILEMESYVENFLEAELCKDYDEVTQFYGGNLSLMHPSNETINNGDSYYETINLTPEQAKELYEAVIADANAGTLMKYNTSSSYNISEDGNVIVSQHVYTGVSMYLEFKDPNAEETETYYSEYYGETTYEYVDEYGTTHIIEESSGEYYTLDNFCYADIGFGPDCENIINKLIEFGIVNSVDDIYFESE